MKQETARVSPHATSKISVSSLPFSEIPGSSRLFLDYLRAPASLRKYYPNAVDSPSDVAGYAPEVLRNYPTDRHELSEALVRINTALGASDASIANARALAGADTVAVVTGQQAGLFTGPLYTIYKALSAVRLAEELDRKGIQAVPVFWVASEDHDLDEVAETFFIGRDGDIARAAHHPPGDVANLPVGIVSLNDQIEQVIGDLFANLPETEFSPETREMLSSAWKPDATFGEGFAKTMLQIFGKYGLVVIDPLDTEIKRLAGPVYVQAIRKAGEIVAAVRARSTELESAGYHAQVMVEEDYFPLFWHNDRGQRIALRKTADGMYREKGGSHHFTLDDLAAVASDEPHRLSPGVMLRPVVQDHLLPTVCYFGGAAEIAYFAQNAEVYRLLDRPVTPIFHRQSFTIVEAKQRRDIDKLDLKVSDLFKGREALLLELAGAEDDETPKIFGDVENEINKQLDRLDSKLSEIDVTLAANLATRRRKIIYHIGTLLKKAMLARSRKDETRLRRVDGLLTALLPNGSLQERSLNVFGYLNEFGPGFLDWLYDAVDLDDKDHRVIDL